MAVGNIRAEIIERMKSDLLGRVDEWVGMDIPEEGSEDYESWQFKLAEIDAIENIQDVVDYVESEGFDLYDFFLCGEYEIVSAGLDPDHVPSGLFKELGELVAEQTWSGGSWVNIHFYDGKYFVVNEAETSIADTRSEAIKLGGIENDSFDDQVHLPQPAAARSTPREKWELPKREGGKRRAVLIVVTNWPDGTMAFKFGGAIQASLDVSEDEMSLVQMAPERIFRVETSVSEVEFREAMGIRDVSYGGSVLFVEIPKA